MTREVAIKAIQDFIGWFKEESLIRKALEMAIKALENHDTFMKYAYSQGKQDALSQEPTKREIEREYLFQSLCEDFKKLQAENDDLRKRLEQEPCDDAVSRQAVIKAITNTSGIRGDALNALYALPPVTQKSGKWDRSCTCSVCGKWRILESEKNGGKYKFCPNCGSAMKGE